MSLTPNQQASLEQLHSITNGDLSIEQSILESVGWDVQVCPYLTDFPWKLYEFSRSERLM
jgi:hypothetical protein